MVATAGQCFHASCLVIGLGDANNANKGLNFAQSIAEFKGLLGVLVGVNDADVQGVFEFIFHCIRGRDDLKFKNNGVQQLANLVD